MRIRSLAKAALNRKPSRKDTAVQRAVREHGYRSLTAAIEAVHAQQRPDGRPSRFEPLAKA